MLKNIIYIFILCFSCKAYSVYSFDINFFSGYTQSNISSSIPEVKQDSSNGYSLGVNSNFIYEKDYELGLNYQYSNSKYIESSEVFANIGAIYDILEESKLSFYFDFLLGINFYRWKSFNWSVSEVNSEYDGSSFIYGFDFGLRSILWQHVELRLYYQNMALGHKVTYIELLPTNNQNSGTVTQDNKSSYFLSLGYLF